MSLYPVKIARRPASTDRWFRRRGEVARYLLVAARPHHGDAWLYALRRDGTGPKEEWLAHPLGFADLFEEITPPGSSAAQPTREPKVGQRWIHRFRSRIYTDWIVAKVDARGVVLVAPPKRRAVSDYLTACWVAIDDFKTNPWWQPSPRLFDPTHPALPRRSRSEAGGRQMTADVGVFEAAGVDSDASAAPWLYASGC